MLDDGKEVAASSTTTKSAPATRATISKASLKKPAASALKTSQKSSVIKPLTVPVESRSTRSTISSSSKQPSVSTARGSSTATALKTKTQIRPAAAVKTAPAKSASVPAGQPPAKKKRKEYDVKGRLQDLEEQHNHTTTQLTESTKLIETMTDKLDMSQSTSKSSS